MGKNSSEPFDRQASQLPRYGRGVVLLFDALKISALLAEMLYGRSFESRSIVNHAGIPADYIDASTIRNHSLQFARIQRNRLPVVYIRQRVSAAFQQVNKLDKAVIVFRMHVRSDFHHKLWAKPF